MKNPVMFINAAVVALTLGLGGVSFANPVKPADPNKIEKKYDKRDLQYFKNIKAKTKKTTVNRKKRKHELDHEVTKRKKNQLDDQTRLVHLKERLNLVKGDEAATNKLNKQIAHTEQRIQKRAERINKSVEKQTAVGNQLTSAEERLAAIQAAIDAKKNEIALDNQLINQQPSDSDGVGSL
ncbi:MAG: hypothetical protein RJB66_290 [Pseudomonadota bacterium]|jgi:chromosome segregation ATPase